MRPSQENFNFWFILNRFLASTSTPRTFKIIVFPLEKRGFFKKSPFEVDFDFGGQHGANLPPFWPQKSTKIPKIPIFRGIQKLIDFCFDFWSFWSPFWGSSWGHVGHQVRLRTAQEASKTPQDAPRGDQIWAPSWISSWSHVGGPLDGQLGAILGPFWGSQKPHFWLHFWINFRVIFK